MSKHKHKSRPRSKLNCAVCEVLPLTGTRTNVCVRHNTRVLYTLGAVPGRRDGSEPEPARHVYRLKPHPSWNAASAGKRAPSTCVLERLRLAFKLLQVQELDGTWTDCEAQALHEPPRLSHLTTHELQLRASVPMRSCYKACQAG